MILDMYQIIYKKRTHQILSKAEIEYFINGYVAEQIPDYQTSALLMALFLNGISDEELFYLTQAMIESGDKIKLPHNERKIIDKHSTGGVGDKTSFVVSSILAAYGFKIGKMSGRGLGFTGGTLDKLESIPGFDISLSNEAFVNQVETVGLSIVGQTKNLVPADKKLYALRDVTATVDHIALIASSIMSKKLASDSDGILLDVKVGSGAFMKDLDSARSLAQTMVSLGKQFDRKTVAVLTNMSDPLGSCVGNALEIKEAIDTLKGNGAEDFSLLCRSLSEIIIGKMDTESSKEQIQKRVHELIASGQAFDKFVEFIVAQGGDKKYILSPELLPSAPYIYSYVAKEKGTIQAIDTQKIGLAAVALGAGRRKKEDTINHKTGFYFHKKLGHAVSEGEVILDIHYETEIECQQALEILDGAFQISPQKMPFEKQMIYEIIE